MLEATVLALVAAVLHAGWNLAAKRSVDRFGALWGQFLLAGVIAATILAFTGPPPSKCYPWALLSACVHVPYTVFLARAYDRGDFSLAYPIARGGGVVTGAIGGALFLDDRLRVLAWIAIGVIVIGLVSLAGRVKPHAIADALVVAATIGVYSVSDAKGVRVAGTDTYVFVGFVLLGTSISLYALITRQTATLRAVLTAHPWTVVLSGIATIATYGLVVAAYRLAAVGYVNGLRESSVVLAALIGWRFLGEQGGRRRLIAAGVVLGGLVLLVLGR
jgi:drug/metabolite transporter (DMT)-like permease